MTNAGEIFVRLLDDCVDVWRPIQAEQLHKNRYRILDQPYDREVEIREFGPGEEVACEMIDSSDGPILAATHLAERAGGN